MLKVLNIELTDKQYMVLLDYALSDETYFNSLSDKDKRFLIRQIKKYHY